MDDKNAQHFAWLASTFGRTEYLPLRPSDIEALAQTGEVIDKYPGTHLFRAGQEALSAYVIERGQVELYRGDNSKRRVIGRAHPGSVLGDIAMFRDEPYKSSARAVNAVTAFRFDRDKLMPVLIQRPVLTLRWLVSGLTQLESTQRRVLGLMHRTVLEQVSELMLDEADQRGEVHLSQASIADLLGASRQTVNEALRELRSPGAISTGYRLIRVQDAPILERISGRRE
jgi:CRP-like cAMP-binding protein